MLACLFQTYLPSKLSLIHGLRVTLRAIWGCRHKNQQQKNIWNHVHFVHCKGIFVSTRPIVWIRIAVLMGRDASMLLFPVSFSSFTKKMKNSMSSRMRMRKNLACKLECNHWRWWKMFMSTNVIVILPEKTAGRRAPRAPGGRGGGSLPKSKNK